MPNDYGAKMRSMVLSVYEMAKKREKICGKKKKSLANIGRGKYNVLT